MELITGAIMSAPPDPEVSRVMSSFAEELIFPAASRNQRYTVFIPSGADRVKLTVAEREVVEETEVKAPSAGVEFVSDK
jgi:hypothetical protein